MSILKTVDTIARLALVVGEIYKNKLQKKDLEKIRYIMEFKHEESKKPASERNMAKWDSLDAELLRISESFAEVAEAARSNTVITK